MSTLADFGVEPRLTLRLPYERDLDGSICCAKDYFGYTGRTKKGYCDLSPSYGLHTVPRRVFDREIVGDPPRVYGWSCDRHNIVLVDAVGREPNLEHNDEQAATATVELAPGSRGILFEPTKRRSVDVYVEHDRPDVIEVRSA